MGDAKVFSMAGSELEVGLAVRPSTDAGSE
jgi:hypothetical protein